MTQKLFLTSAIAMGVIAPAVAAPTYTDAFPDDGYMQEDYTYTNAATADNMDSVYEGTVNAVAEYDVIDYILSAGQYLPADSETPTTCPAGSYCSGIGEVQYNETSAQGIATCPTGYALSADGASSANECYRTCTTSDVEHSTGVTGGYYYGNNNQCGATGCVNGWHLKSGVNGTAIATAIGNTEGTNSAYIRADGTFREINYDGLGAKGQAYYGISDNISWAVDYGTNGMLIGQGRCSTVQGVFDFDWRDKLNQPITTHTTSELGAEGGQYCYCNVTGYKDASGTLQSLSSPWVFNTGNADASACASACVSFCAAEMRLAYPKNRAFRAAMLDSATSNAPSICEANTITINWDDVDPEYAGQNNEGTAIYGEDVRTPVKANTYKGKTFKGWRFSKPTTTQLP